MNSDWPIEPSFAFGNSQAVSRAQALKCEYKRAFYEVLFVKLSPLQVSSRASAICALISGDTLT